MHWLWHCDYSNPRLFHHLWSYRIATGYIDCGDLEPNPSFTLCKRKSFPNDCYWMKTERKDFVLTGTPLALCWRVDKDKEKELLWVLRVSFRIHETSPAKDCRVRCTAFLEGNIPKKELAASITVFGSGPTASTLNKSYFHWIKQIQSRTPTRFLTLPRLRQWPLSLTCELIAHMKSLSICSSMYDTSIL